MPDSHQAAIVKENENGIADMKATTAPRQVSPVSKLGGRSPSSPPPHPPSSPSKTAAWTHHWAHEQGLHLTVHNWHGYLAWDTLALTEEVVQGRTVIGLYFSAEWCPPCRQFTPFIKQLHARERAHCTKTNTNILLFEVGLVSQCCDAAATKLYFSTMPWTAMTHAEASGVQGLALQDKCAITTIPALVLLDGKGAVIYRNGQNHLLVDPTGKYFPWQEPPATPRHQ
jgi:nucleoredoxin